MNAIRQLKAVTSLDFATASVEATGRESSADATDVVPPGKRHGVSVAHQPSRLVNETEAARIIGWSPSRLSRCKSELEKIGFPRRHPKLKRRDRVAIERWIDEQFGITQAPRDVDALIKQRLANLGTRT